MKKIVQDLKVQIDAMYEGSLSKETPQTKRIWTDILQTQREDRWHQWLLYQTQLPIAKHEKVIWDKSNFKQCLSTTPTLQKALERKLKPKEIKYTQENTMNK